MYSRYRTGAHTLTLTVTWASRDLKSNQRRRAADASGQAPLQFSRDAIEEGLLSFGNLAEAEKTA